MPPATHLYDENFWKETLGKEFKKKSLTERLHLIFSLSIFLVVTIAQYLTFIFDSDILVVKQRAGKFMGTLTTPWPPEVIYNLWHEQFPKAREGLHTRIQMCALEIAKKESDRLIAEPMFKIKIKNLTVRSIKEILQPSVIAERLQEITPFM